MGPTKRNFHGPGYPTMSAGWRSWSDLVFWPWRIMKDCSVSVSTYFAYMFVWVGTIKTESVFEQEFLLFFEIQVTEFLAFIEIMSLCFVIRTENLLGWGNCALVIRRCQWLEDSLGLICSRTVSCNRWCLCRQCCCCEALMARTLSPLTGKGD